METLGVTLTDAEQSYFQDLFSSCDTDNQGKASGSKTAELFRCSQLSPEILERITELCGAKRLGHFGRSQFYVALKLIAAVQAGLPLKPETFSSGIDIPLPKFVRDLPRSYADEATMIKYEILKRSTDSIPGINRDSQNSSPSSSPKERVHWTSFHNDDAHSDHDHLLANDGEESSERGHSSDEDGPADVWTISAEQDRYYKNQFASMQSDMGKKISGSVAKEFFEKSKLPVHELSKIWQLSDVDKDGALSISEFCTAMHLVVLRRNNIELPEALPPSLVPVICKAASPLQDQMSPQNKEWTKFVESPNSALSSPGAKPVSFDFSAASVEQDPQILHPVALRLTPDQPHNDLSAEGEPVALPHHQHHHQQQQPLEDAVDAPPLSLQPKKEPPPPPPPRPKRNHARSSSLDLNRLGKSEPSFLHSSAPAVPPRISPSAAGAFEVYRKPASSLSLDIDCNSRGGQDPTLAAILSRDKQRHPSAPSIAAEIPRDRRQLQASIRSHREKNMLLSRLNSELNQELSEVMEERIALEIQLEHLKPLSYG